MTGAGGFIGGHLAARLRSIGYEVVATDIAPAKHPLPGAPPVIVSDLRGPPVQRLFDGVDVVFALAADMGGMGRISRDRASLMSNNVTIDLATFEASRRFGVHKVVFTSSACVYPQSLQMQGAHPLVESDAFPADPRDPYGLSKLYSEELLREFAVDYDIAPRIARLHNVYGPYGAFAGGLEKVPAALCRKVALAHEGESIEVWGDGEQLRTFCYIDDCVEALIRLSESEFPGPVNIGSSEVVSINELAQLIIDYSGKGGLSLRHVVGPEGVRTRNCDNGLAEHELGWRPVVQLVSGVQRTYDWIASELAKDGMTHA